MSELSPTPFAIASRVPKACIRLICYSTMVVVLGAGILFFLLFNTASSMVASQHDGAAQAFLSAIHPRLVDFKKMKKGDGLSRMSLLMALIPQLRIAGEIP